MGKNKQHKQKPLYRHICWKKKSLNYQIAVQL